MPPCGASWPAPRAVIVTTPLPRDRPLWRTVVVTGAPDGGVGVVVVMHHVIADGIGGLALLAEIADRAAEPAAPGVGEAPPQAERPDAPSADRSENPGSGQGATRRALPAAFAALRHARLELGGGPAATARPSTTPCWSR